MILTKIQKIRVQQVPGTHSHGTCLTDHRAVTLLININENQRGPNYWKLNTSLLEDENYKAIIKDLIHRYNTKLGYGKLDVDLHTLWEQFKHYGTMNVVTLLKHYGSMDKTMVY